MGTSIGFAGAVGLFGFGLIGKRGGETIAARSTATRWGGDLATRETGLGLTAGL